MIELASRTPCNRLLPLEIGSCTLTEEDLGRLTIMAPFRGRDAALSDRLKAAHGMALPGPNRATGRAGNRAIWFGRRQVLLAGPEPAPGLADHAALVDQSDAWAVVRLQGPQASDVLARLVPVDLRSRHFKPGHTARTDLMHMNASITRVADAAFLIMVFRSMAATLVHDLKTAMEGVAARG